MTALYLLSAVYKSNVQLLSVSYQFSHNYVSERKLAVYQRYLKCVCASTEESPFMCVFLTASTSLEMVVIS